MNTVLPIGSVVRLKDLNQPIMIFGYLQQSALKGDQVWDYVGIPYPQGNIDMSYQLGFMMTDIEEVLFEGYRTEEFKPMEMVLNVRRVLAEKEAEA